MSTATLSRADRTSAPGTSTSRRHERVFFSGLALLFLITILVGFAPSYYLAGLYRAPLPSPIIHWHAAVFTCWILLLIVQTSLVSAGRTDIHRRLGIIGFLLACSMPVVGVLAATDALVRGFGPSAIDARAFYATPLTDMLIFSVLVFLAFRVRRRSSTHKRMIMIATVALMTAPIARMHFALVHRNPTHAELASYLFLLLLVSYDLWSQHRIQRATIWASAFLVTLQQGAHLLGRTAAWHGFASWVQAIAR